MTKLCEKCRNTKYGTYIRKKKKWVKIGEYCFECGFKKSHPDTPEDLNMYREQDPEPGEDPLC